MQIIFKEKIYEPTAQHLGDMELFSNYFAEFEVLDLDTIDCIKEVTSEQFEFVWNFYKHPAYNCENTGTILKKSCSIRLDLEKKDRENILLMSKYLCYDRLTAIMIIYNYFKN